MAGGEVSDGPTSIGRREGGWLEEEDGEVVKESGEWFPRWMS